MNRLKAWEWALLGVAALSVMIMASDALATISGRPVLDLLWWIRR